MSTENDVPLGDGARRYYEQQFGDRIRQVNKGSGSAPKRSGDGSNWNGRAGCGGAVAVFIVIRIIIALARHSSSMPSHDYSPPQRFEVPENVPLEDFLKEARENRFQPPAIHLPENVEEATPLLGEVDVPLLQGLCYRIHRESQKAGNSPGKHISDLLTPGERRLLVRIAEEKPLDPFEAKLVLIALNDVLSAEDFFEEASFRKVSGVAALIRKSGFGDNPALGSPRFNRLILEKCYPQQIVPLSDRDTLNVRLRAIWLQRAQFDLAEARKQADPAKR